MAIKWMPVFDSAGRKSKYSIRSACDRFTITCVYIGEDAAFGLYRITGSGPGKLVEYFSTSEEAKDVAEEIAKQEQVGQVDHQPEDET